MTDLEMLKLCAEAVGETVVEYQTTAGPILIVPDVMTFEPLPYTYDPFRDAQQLLDLVKKFRLDVIPRSDGGWTAMKSGPISSCPTMAVSQDFNRAIVECAAKLQKQKTQ